MTVGETVTKRVRHGPRLPANRHSFFGFESGSMATAFEVNSNSPPAKYTLPDSHLLNANNLSSTPAPKVLHPLIEDESPISPSKVSKSLFQGTDVCEKQSDIVDIRIVDVNKSEAVDELLNVSKSFETEKNANSDFANNPPEADKCIIESESNKNEIESESENTENRKDSLSETLFPMKIGDTIQLGDGVSGQVRFIGNTQFANGVWVGIELKNPKGMLIEADKLSLCL